MKSWAVSVAVVSEKINTVILRFTSFSMGTRTVCRQRKWVHFVNMISPITFKYIKLAHCITKKGHRCRFEVYAGQGSSGRTIIFCLNMVLLLQESWYFDIKLLRLEDWKRLLSTLYLPFKADTTWPAEVDICKHSHLIRILSCVCLVYVCNIYNYLGSLN